MSNISDVYCFIDTKNQTNKCEDNNYNIVYDNNKMGKVNYNNSLGLNNKNYKSISTNNNTIKYAYANVSNMNATNMDK